MKFHEKIKTGINWDIFTSQVDLIHDDKPVYIPNFLPNPNNYITWKNIEDYINFSQGYFRIIDKENIDPPLIKSFYNKDIQDKNYIHNYISRGYSFAFYGHSMIHPYASSLCSEIDNLFLVNSESQVIGSINSNCDSFPPHMDANPVFVFQSQGTIEWTLYDNKVSHLGPRNFVNAHLDYNKLSNPKTYTLTPGDFLYVPERTYHNIKVKSSRLTLSINCFDFRSSPSLDRNYYKL